jgi:tetratricopeptide (TPR) repeat protein
LAEVLKNWDLGFIVTYAWNIRILNTIYPHKMIENKQSGWPVIALVVILLAGLIVRIVYLRENMNQPEFTHPAIDGAYHDYWARGLAGMGWSLPDGYADPRIRTLPYFRPPGYPYLLGAVYLISGGSYLTPRIVQMILGLVGVAAAFVFARRWYGDRTALIFSGLMAFYWSFIYFEGELLGAGIAVFLAIILLAVSSAWIEKFGFMRGFSAGVVLGIYALFRPNILLFAPVLIIWAFYLGRRRLSRGRISILFAGFLLGCALSVLPVTVRNYIVAGDPVMISAQGGMSLLIGNNESSDGTNHYLPGFGMMSSPFDYPEAVRGLEAELGLEKESLSYSAASRAYAIRAIEFIIGHPEISLRLLARKTALFWGPAEVTNNRDISTVLAHSNILRLIPFSFSFCLASCLLGLFFCCSGTDSVSLSASSRQASLLVVLFIGTYFISVLPFVAAARYRLPVIPGMLLFSALALDRLMFIFINRKYKRFFIRLVILGGLILLTSLNLSGYESSPSKWHYDRGLAYEESGNPAAAEAEYLQALELKPDDFRSRINLGALLLKRNDAAGAIREYQLAIRACPDQAEAYSNLGEAYLEEGEYHKAIENLRKAIAIDPASLPAYNNLGIVLRLRGDRVGAVEAFRHALRINPNYEEGQYNLGVILASLSRFDEAIEHYRIALRINPTGADILNNLGSALASRGDSTDAYYYFTEAFRLDPGMADAHNNLANILAERKDYHKAIEHYEQALKINPDYGEASYNLAYTLDLMGDSDEARRNYERSLRINPLNARAHYNLAIIFLKDQRRDEAVKHLERTLALDPEFAPARQLLEKIMGKQ